MDEITVTQWAHPHVNTDSLGEIKYFIFLDINTIQRNANYIVDYTLALQIASQRIELYDFGVIETKRNQQNNAWLVKCIISD
ncbi:hypothetical protein Q4557_19485 [Shewanella sp. 5_MG-2023]|uniref:hypothetical protein n=1 Tax=Shewanella sp. 5_MG-2023 TaxID=3062656 RepID=UPI0026E1FF92|nr:hypothetical protein [Shewanella sp. 5_MG-2023]MDO6642133.1 hypothetical protein [Shewanella sp. 5_MG-2023]